MACVLSRASAINAPALGTGVDSLTLQVYQGLIKRLDSAVLGLIVHKLKQMLNAHRTTQNYQVTPDDAGERVKSGDRRVTSYAPW